MHDASAYSDIPNVRSAILDTACVWIGWCALITLRRPCTDRTLLRQPFFEVRSRISACNLDRQIKFIESKCAEKGSYDRFGYVFCFFLIMSATTATPAISPTAIPAAK